MGTNVRRTGGSAALAGVVGLALVCILLAQKSPVPGCRVPRSAPAQPLSEPHGCAADSLPELPALTSPFTPPDGDGLRLTGISVTPTSVVLGAGWPAGLLAPGEPLDVLCRACLEDGFWRPLAWTRPPASATGLAVEVPSALLPGGAGAASFFALARSALRDTDGDGLPDAWECAHGLDPASDDGRDGADGDPDGDGLPNLGEYRLGADPLAPDTDGDGLADGEEAGGIWLDALDRMVHPSPALADTDGDGVADGDEVDAGSDPELADSDSDGMSDAEELGAVSVLRGDAFAWPDLSGGVDLLAGATGVVRERVWTFDLAWPVVFGGRTFTRVCVDLSGALHLLQSGDPAPAAPLAGGDDLRWPSPWDRDLPADALFVAACWCWNGLALDPSAGSALRVYDDASAHATVVEFRHAMRGASGDGRDDWATFRVVLSADADDVARIDVLEASDGFLDATGGTVGVLDLSRGSYRDPDWFCHVQYASYLRPAPLEPRTSVVLRLGTGTDPSRGDTDGDGLGDRAEIREHGTDPVRADTDGDLLPDGWELGNGLDPFVPDGDDGRDGDPDGDGLPNRGEFLAGSDPRNRHSDTDGLPDGEECGGIVETNALPWLAFDAGSAADLAPVLAGEWDRVADWTLPVPLTLPGGTCTNAVLDSSGAVYLMRAGVASPTSPPPVRDLGEEVALRDALVLAPAWGALWSDVDAAEPTCVRAGTATHGGEAYILFEFERARCGSAWEGGALSFQVAVPAACADRAYVRYRDVAGDAADGRFAVVGLQGLDGRTRASWCAWEEGRIQEGLQLLFLFGQGSDPSVDDTDGDGLRDDAERTEGTDPADPDTDGDGLPDGWEAAYSACGFDPRVDNARDGVRDTDPDADPDGDGLTNAEEAMWGTNPSGRDDDRDGRPDGADTDGDGVEDGAEVRQSSDPADASDGGLPGSRAKVVFRFGDYSGSESERYRLELACVEGGGPDVVRAGVLGRVVPAEAMLKPGCAYEARLRHAGTAPQYRGVPGFPDYDYELELASAPPNVLLEDPQGLFGRVGAGPYDPFLAELKTARLSVVKIALRGVLFNHDPHAHDADAINIRPDATGTYDLSCGEWTDGGATNFPACYVGGVKPVLKARFAVEPRSVRAVRMSLGPAASGFPLAGFADSMVSFSEGLSEWTCFRATQSLARVVRRCTGSLRWRATEANGTDLGPFDVATSGPHRIYVTLDHPVIPPWSRSPSGSQRAWANALDVACGAADGESQERGAVAAITRHLFHNMGFSYNSLDSGAKYSGFGDFHLTSYLDTLSYLAGSNRLVNCIDQANGLTTLVNVLGIPATVLRVEPFGYIKPTNVVGVNGMCNNPIFGAEDSPDVPLCSDDDVFRSAFGYHAVTYTKWGIYDATLGPVVGLPYQSYISTIIDASTAEEYAASVFAAGTNSNTCTYSVIDVLR